MTDYPNYKSPAARQKDRIREDIAAIDKAIESCNPKLILQMHQHIDGKYQACIAGWTQSLYGYVPGYGINYEVIDVNDLIHNLQIMKPKLEGFIEGWNAITSPATMPTTVPEINVNTTTNVNITITFEQVRAKIEDMTSLTEEQTKEALEKVSVIEDVVKSGGSKKSKWEKIKPILAWLADKSFDVAMTILPLLLQVQG